ncbi:unnamed protein product [Pieris brassicae]|uniref:Uncharacterized protein n=1 Tax=Pieris brassicae TaxID=7116 RepID=A0A9P0TTZ1_PIEBR|nr:unnamed protein product [Pieris brassicae]
MPAPRALVFHGDRPEPVEGGRPTPPTSSGTGVTHFVSRAVFQRERPRVLVDRKLFRAPFKGPLHLVALVWVAVGRLSIRSGHRSRRAKAGE